MTDHVERLWARLLRRLDTRGLLHDHDSGGILVRRTKGPLLQVVMTPDEWYDTVSVLWGDVDDALDHLERTLLDAGPSVRFLVYVNYALEPSGTSEIRDL